MELVNQQLIKNENMKLLYNTIYDNSGISRAQLAQQTRLSKTTVSTLIDELITRDFIYDSGANDTTSVGRRPNSLHVKAESYYIIVISWIESYVNAYLIDITGSTTYDEHLHLNDNDTYISLSRKYVDESILTKLPRDKILGICVVVSAMIDRNAGEIYSTTVSLPKSGNVNLIDTLKSTFTDFPVALLGDTPCFAYAEKTYAHITEPDFVLINFDRGIGATIFNSGKMIGRADGASTQFGHYSIDPQGDLCTCGNRGCLEAVWGEHALKKRVSEAGTSPALNRLPAITFSSLGSAALYGDVISQKVIVTMAESFSYALANLISIVNPKLIILGGKSTYLGDLFLEKLKEKLKVVGLKKMVDKVEIKYSKLDSNAYLNGAMKYFFDNYYAFTEESRDAFFIG